MSDFSSIDIILNSIDNTGPACDSAIMNFNVLGDTVEAVNTQIVAAEATSGIAKMIGSLFTVQGAVTVAAAAFAGFGVAVATNAFGIRDTVASVIESISNITVDWSAVWDGVVRGVVTGFAILEFGFKNLRLIGDTALITLELAIVRTGNQIVYFFTEVIPATLTWFADNWTKIFRDIGSYVGTVVTNMHENLVRFFTATIEWLQGNGFNFEWKALTEGFEASLTELPQIMARQKTQLEQDLEQTLNDLVQGVFDGVTENIRKRLKEIPSLIAGARGIMGRVWDTITGAFSGTEMKHNIQLGLPSIGSERFTTGVTAAGQESVANQLAQLNASQKEATTAAKETARTVRTIATPIGGPLFGALCQYGAEYFRKGGGGIRLPK